MKRPVLATVVAGASATVYRETPVAKVVTLLTEMKAGIEGDGEKEQRSYNKFACWCEDTAAQKAQDITAAKDLLESTQTNILKLKSELSIHATEIERLKRDVASNSESEKEATEVREKEAADYAGSKIESEQCLGALEAALKVLSGAGGGKKAFLESVQIIDVVDGVRGVLGRPEATHAASETDLEVVRHFVEKPEDFVGTLRAASALQRSSGAARRSPQSSEIVGILKSMYDSFAADLEKSTEEEAVKQKAFEELMGSKRDEQTTQKATLQKHETDKANKGKELADSQTAVDDGSAQLAADEKFFGETKTSCKTKAADWAERVRLRTEELAGIGRAIELLSSQEASGTFESAHATSSAASSASSFMQRSARHSPKVAAADASASRAKASAKIAVLAAKYSSVSLGKLALKVRAGGHFSHIIPMIDQMVTMLRTEQEDDVKHRDRCQNKESKLQSDIAGLNHDLTKAGKSIERLGTDRTQQQEALDVLNADLAESRTSLQEMKDMRADEIAELHAATKDDADAVKLLEQAIVELSKFYKDNKIPLGLAQLTGAKRAEPKPETSFQDGQYGGRSTQSGGVIGILTLIKEDLEKEIRVAEQDDAEAAESYRQNTKALRETIRAQDDSRVQQEAQMAELEGSIADLNEHRQQHESDLAAEQDEKDALTNECSWVALFDDRRKKRDSEIEGLVEAKNYLAGVSAGTEIEA